MTRFYKVCRFITTAYCRIAFRFHGAGFENIPESGPAVICCNHISAFDPLLLAACCKNRQLIFMAKKELFNYKLSGWFLRKVGAFPVNRGGNDLGAIKKAQDILKNGHILGIFPEGTRSKDEKILQGKAGAALIAVGTKSMVIPVAIYHKGNGIKLFRKITLRCGEPISYDELNSTRANKAGLQNTIDYIMDRIKALRELG